jgi:hypothetical protein
MTVSAPSATTTSRSSAALDDAGEHLGPGGLGEGRELAKGVLGVLGGAVGPDRGQHDPLETQLTVLDLGDVGELGGESGDPAQGGALLALEAALVEARLVAVVEQEARVVVLVRGESAGPGGEEVGGGVAPGRLGHVVGGVG